MTDIYVNVVTYDQHQHDVSQGWVYQYSTCLTPLMQ